MLLVAKMSTQAPVLGEDLLTAMLFATKLEVITLELDIDPLVVNALLVQTAVFDEKTAVLELKVRRG